jgi:hypothetical protein
VGLSFNYLLTHSEEKRWLSNDRRISLLHTRESGTPSPFWICVSPCLS